VSLVEHTLFGVVDKVQIAIDRIRQFEPPEGYYVAFSGGKDSCVVKDLVKRAGVKADYHYNLTTVDPPELVYFIREHHADVEVHKPKETMWQLIARKGDLPLRHRRWCCAILKEGGGKGRTVVTGIRWAESSRRANRQMVESCTKDAKYFLHPIIDWSNEEIWKYIKDNNLPYCKLYDEGFHRLGCVMCPMQHDITRDRERWPKIYAAYKHACEKGWPVLKKRKDEKGEVMTWKSADDWFYWWSECRDGVEQQDPDQTVMFE
jgi:phosphoadenosine phosphosulfate reductase